MPLKTRDFYEFGPFRVDASERQLFRGSEEISLTPKAFDILLLMLRHPGETLTKEEFMREVWPDAVVEEANLTDNISTLRQILGDDAREPIYIRTIPKRGYRFLAEVRSASGSEPLPDLPTPAETAPPPIVRAKNAVARRTLVVVLLIGAVASGIYFVMRRPAIASARTPIARSIAVLPFQSLGGAADPALELGLTDAIIARLSNVRQLEVRPTTSVLKYAKGERDIPSIASELDADVILDGRVQRAGDRVRVSVQLLRGADGVPIWADRFDEHYTDLFQVQDSVSARAAEALDLTIRGDERQRMVRRLTHDLEAYDLYLRGRYHWSTFRPEDLEIALKHYKEAVRRDPKFALAWSGIADVYTIGSITGPYEATQAMPKAIEAAQRSVSLAPDLAEPRVSLGAVKICFERDWKGAQREVQLAANLNPNNADAPTLYAYTLQAFGRPDEAIPYLQRARELAPSWDIARRDVWWGLYIAGRYEETIAQTESMMQLDHGTGAVFQFALAAIELGRFADAERALMRYLADTGRRHAVLLELGILYAKTGRKPEAESIIAELKESKRPVAPREIAEIYAALGNAEEAFAWLDRAVERRYPKLWAVRNMPVFAPYRNDVRFHAFLRKLNVEP